MTTQKVRCLEVGDVIIFNGEEYSVSGTDSFGRHDVAVYLCNEQATDWRLPLLAGDKVQVVRHQREAGDEQG